MTLDAWRAAGAYFDFHGHAIFHRVDGEPTRAPALLCIHGFPTASWDWQATWPALRARFACVIAPDMLGFGFSAKPHPHDYSMLEQADLHEALLAKLRIRRVHVLAHDYGDTVAQELLAREIEDRVSLLSVAFLNGGL
ncbi:MAG TPA: alpha/beta fold hydrolase, partial [Kofleriaceae bacterium]